MCCSRVPELSAHSQCTESSTSPPVDVSGKTLGKAAHRPYRTFYGPFMFFVVVDAHSKWPEVTVMDSTTSEKTVDVLRELFSLYGVPTQIVSDNGPQFVSKEF